VEFFADQVGFSAYGNCLPCWLYIFQLSPLLLQNFEFESSKADNSADADSKKKDKKDPKKPDGERMIVAFTK
jgi:hypothetical protein